MIRALVTGSLYGDPQARTSQAGKQYVTAKVRADGKDGASVPRARGMEGGCPTVGRVNESHPRLPATVIIFTLIIITPSPAENPLVAYQPNPKIQDYPYNHE